MRKLGAVLGGVAGVLLLVGLAVVLSLALQGLTEDGPATPAVGEATVAAAVDQSPLPTPEELPTRVESAVDQSPLPTPEETATRVPMPSPTLEPTATAPPVPTPLPTPVVTPVPVAEPPFIPGMADQPTQPYRIVVRTENTLWAVNNDGTDAQLLIDTESQAGLYMRFIPSETAEDAGEWSVSPDGTRLALTLFAIERREYQGQRALPSIHILEVATGDLSPLVEGRAPVWSPDGRRIAFVREGSLWVADATTGEEREIFPVEGGYAADDLVWSPDGNRIAFSHGPASLGRDAEMLVAALDEEKVDRLIPRTGYGLGNLSWSPGGWHISYLSHLGKRTGPNMSPNLWVTTSDGAAQTQLTKDMHATGVPRWSPDGMWISFVGTQHYAEPKPVYCLWLLRPDGSELRRLTRDRVFHLLWWSPDGTQIIFQRTEQGIWTMDLRDGGLKQVYPGEAGVPYSDMAVVGRAK